MLINSHSVGAELPNSRGPTLIQSGGGGLSFSRGWIPIQSGMNFHSIDIEDKDNVSTYFIWVPLYPKGMIASTICWDAILVLKSYFIMGFEVGRLCLIFRSLRHCARNVVLLRVFKLFDIAGTNSRGILKCIVFLRCFKGFRLCLNSRSLRHFAKTLFY